MVILATMMVTVTGSVWSLALWITRQFSIHRDLVYKKFDQLLERLESHEKHDNSRFQDVNNHLWELRLDNANLSNYRKGQSLDQESKDRAERQDRTSYPS